MCGACCFFSFLWRSNIIRALLADLVVLRHPRDTKAKLEGISFLLWISDAEITAVTQCRLCCVVTYGGEATYKDFIEQHVQPCSLMSTSFIVRAPHKNILHWRISQSKSIAKDSVSLVEADSSFDSSCGPEDRGLQPIAWLMSRHCVDVAVHNR